jgi:hypothetical protein
MALSLVQDCETAYGEAPDRLRGQFNQAIFKRTLIDDEYTVTGELAEPFETLLSEELRQAAARKAEDDLSRAVEDVFRGRERQEEALNPELELAGAVVSGPPATVRDARV